ncbi:MAG: hypothetical protein NTZ93_03895 [Candidatus Beckwithbacteria bacterium]|nr:hypothetical protein [Candidatus Beckwithbacteria bacterium]
MKKDNKWLLWGLIGFTAILLITAIILFLQLRKPTQPLPTPKPVASPQVPEINVAGTAGVCELSFTVTASPSPSPSPGTSPSPSPSPGTSPSPSPSPGTSPQPNVCFDTCSTDDECKVANSEWRCMTVSGDKRCVNPNCTDETDCNCNIASSPNPTIIAYASPTLPPQTKGGQPVLPQAGISGPAVLGVSAGLLLMLAGLLLF